MRGHVWYLWASESQPSAHPYLVLTDLKPRPPWILASSFFSLSCCPALPWNPVISSSPWHVAPYIHARMAKLSQGPTLIVYPPKWPLKVTLQTQRLSRTPLTSSSTYQASNVPILCPHYFGSFWLTNLTSKNNSVFHPQPCPFHLCLGWGPWRNRHLDLPPFGPTKHRSMALPITPPLPLQGQWFRSSAPCVFTISFLLMLLLTLKPWSVAWRLEEA